MLFYLHFSFPNNESLSERTEIVALRSSHVGLFPLLIGNPNVDMGMQVKNAGPHLRLKMLLPFIFLNLSGTERSI